MHYSLSEPKVVRKKTLCPTLWLIVSCQPRVQPSFTSTTTMARQSSRKRGESDPNKPPKKQKFQHVDDGKELGDKEPKRADGGKGKGARPAKKAGR